MLRIIISNQKGVESPKGIILMDAFMKYILNAKNLKDRVFISNPPCPALLIWSNINKLQNITGISVVEQINSNNCPGLSGEALLKIVDSQIAERIPTLHIQYHHQMDYMVINSKKLSLSESASLISYSFSVEMGETPSKRPNKPDEIKDPFHVWSRNAFDGNLVVKTDIDLVMINENRISSIIEIKRSAKIPVGRWKPYIDPKSTYNDIPNYLITIAFCKDLITTFHTVHHDQVSQYATMHENQLIDVFTCSPLRRVPDQKVLNSFASNENRNLIKVSDFVQYL